MVVLVDVPQQLPLPDLGDVHVLETRGWPRISPIMGRGMTSSNLKLYSLTRLDVGGGGIPESVLSLFVHGKK